LKVLVVGLNPSKKHAKSSTLKNLVKWLDYLNLNTVSFTNLYHGYEIDSNQSLHQIKDIANEYLKVIALGNQVSSALQSLAIDHFKLPHPSGRNRKLNDHNYVHERLEMCKNYLRGA
jgi:hypothetical protein